MRQEKKKIALNPPQAGLANLGNAFAGLNLTLPEAPAQPEATAQVKPVEPEKKARRGRVLLRKETAHRGGKVVIVVHDFPAEVPTPEIENMGRRLKHSLGCGGTVRDRMIEIQGEHPAKITEFLKNEGFRVGGAYGIVQ